MFYSTGFPVVRFIIPIPPIFANAGKSLECGIELKVVKACDESAGSSDSCGCGSGDDQGFTCCGKELKKK